MNFTSLSTFVSGFLVGMVLQGAWRATTQQLHRWRPLSRFWPLSPDVRDLVRRLGCARRGSRAGTKKSGRPRPAAWPNVNINISTCRPSADRDVGVIRTVLSARQPFSSTFQRHVGRCEARTPVRLAVELVNVIPVVITARRSQAAPHRVSSPVNRRSLAAVRVVKHPPSAINIGQLNTQSVGNKSAAVSDLIVEHHLDVLAVVESWHDAADSPSLIAATPPGYCYLEKARRVNCSRKQTKQNHGGICVFLRSSFIAHSIRLPTYTTLEALLLTIRRGAMNISLLTLYWPGSRPISEEFFNDVTDLLERCSQYSQFCVVGDINVHLDDVTSTHTRRLQQLFDEFGLQERVLQPTHKCRHQLDICALRDTSRLLNIDVYPPMLSDHSLIVATVDTRSESVPTPKQQIRRRRWAAFDHAEFQRELCQSQLLLNPPDDVDELFASYNTTITDILDKLAPYTDVRRYARKVSPWYDHDCYITKLQTRRLERAYRRSRDRASLAAWRSQFNRQRALFDRKYVEYWSRKIYSSNGNSKTLWSHLRCLLSQPTSTGTPHSADEFARHFSDKISGVRLTTSRFSQPIINGRQVSAPLASFRPVTAAEISTMIRKAPAKQCTLDPLPTWLLKSACDTLSPVIARMCNASIEQCTFPHNHKSAVVRPLLKKVTMDQSDLSSFRPISNLSFISKLLERVIDARLTQHANINGLFSPVQSAYRRFHSTETALAKIHNDIVTSVDEGNVGALVLLDLSSAFDTVDHQILLQILESRFAISDDALSWFQSYLSNRSHVIHFGGGTSSVIAQDCGVPQGSVIGPKSFIAYTEELDSVFLKHGIHHHGYADDTQAYLAVTRPNASIVAPRLQHCLRDVNDFYGSRRLQLNASKTEVMWFGSAASLDGLTASDKNVDIGNATVHPVDSVRNLGVYLDSLLDMHVHISKTAQACHFQLRRLRRVRRLLGRDVTSNLVAALILTKLDYGNALLAGLPHTSVAPYQRVINAAVRLVYGLRYRDHVTPAAIELHWLPAEARIQYKLCLLVHHALAGRAPAYITDLLLPVAAMTSRRTVLRSATTDSLFIPRTRLRFGERAFRVAAPKAWNQLPNDVRSIHSTNTFKQKLKTFLFTKFYCQPANCSCTGQLSAV